MDDDAVKHVGASGSQREIVTTSAAARRAVTRRGSRPQAAAQRSKATKTTLVTVMPMAKTPIMVQTAILAGVNSDPERMAKAYAMAMASAVRPKLSGTLQKMRLLNDTTPSSVLRWPAKSRGPVRKGRKTRVRSRGPRPAERPGLQRRLQFGLGSERTAGAFPAPWRSA